MLRPRAPVLPRLVLTDGGPPPVQPSGTVYGVLLNDAEALVQLGDAVHAAPYKAPPRAPVLYLKPRNTLATSGEAVIVDRDVAGLQIGAAVGIVIGRTATRLAPDTASSAIAGYVLVVDLCVPHAAYYRPSVRFRARDGSCLVGSTLAPAGSLDPNAVHCTVAIDGETVPRPSTTRWSRTAARLLVDVTEFMTLRSGDILLAGIPADAPVAGAGQSFAASAEGLGRIEGRLVAEPS